MANLMSGHRDLANPDERAEVALLWGVDSVLSAPGLTAIELFDATHDGKIKALRIPCTNPARSLPEQERLRKALTRCDFVVLQEVYRNTETAPFADLLLPAATWGEKEGTVTNPERRITHVHRALTPPGEARSDWRIVSDFARELGPRRLLADASIEIRSGQAFIAMHWGGNSLNSAEANALTLRDFDPYSKQPELKHAAVQVEKAVLPFQALIMRGEPGTVGDEEENGTDDAAPVDVPVKVTVGSVTANAAGLALERAEALAPWLERFGYASLARAGRYHPAVVLRIAHDQPIPPEWLAELDALLGLDDEHCLAYTDTRRGITKRARIENGLLVGLRLTGETAGASSVPA